MPRSLALKCHSPSPRECIVFTPGPLLTAALLSPGLVCAGAVSKSLHTNCRHYTLPRASSNILKIANTQAPE
jgi:hypothetical protein